MRATLQKTENGYGLKEMVAFVSSVRPDHKHKKLSLKNCQAIELGYDLEELAETIFPSLENSRTSLCMWISEMERISQRSAFIKGFQKALEILGDRKFSEEDIRKAIQLIISSCGVKRITNRYVPDELLDEVECGLNEKDIIQELKQTEWDVEVVMENDNQCDGCKAGYELVENSHIDAKTGKIYMNCQKDIYQRPKLDADGCLILKRL